MTSPRHKRRIKCELVDMVRRLIDLKGDTITSGRPGRDTIVYRLYNVGPICVRCESDGHTQIDWRRTSRRGRGWRVLSFTGKGYRFGRQQNFELILKTLVVLGREMVLDDLAGI